MAVNVLKQVSFTLIYHKKFLSLNLIFVFYIHNMNQQQLTAVNIFFPPSFLNYMNLCVISGCYNFVFTFLFHSAIKFISSVNNNMCLAGHLVTQLIVTMNRVTSKFLT